MYLPRNTLMPLAGEIKKAVEGTPVIGAGSIIVPEEAERFVAEGQCDLVALGRTLLAEPHWALKAQQARRVRPCIRCNVCHHQLWLGEPLVCQVNPYLLKETHEPLQPSSRKKKVMVVGAGPGGINAALTAAARGHDVTLYDAQPQIGGMLYPGSRPNCKQELGLLLKYYEEELADSSVKVTTGVQVTLKRVQQEKPDTLVLAVGSRPAFPEIPGVDQPHVITAVDALRDRESVQGENVVVIGGGEVGCETACYLAEVGKSVTVVEILPRLADGQEINNVRMFLYKLLDEEGITYLTETSVTQISEGRVEVKGPQGSRTLEADTVVIAVGCEPSKVERDTLRLGCTEVHVVGDCGTLGRIREAVAQGNTVGRLI
jgi:2-enoate reductase